MSSRFSSQLPSGYDHPLVCRGRQTTARGGCNASHRHDKISMKVSKCAISKQHNQNGRPSRYQDVNERKKCVKAEQKRKHVRKYQKRKKNRWKIKRIQQEKRSTQSECCAISPRRHPKVKNDAKDRVDGEP